jgi:hypothetical protein
MYITCDRSPKLKTLTSLTRSVTSGQFVRIVTPLFTDAFRLTRLRKFVRSCEGDSPNGAVRLPKVVADGVLVSTAAGSTSYARAMGAPPLPLQTPALGLLQFPTAG